MTDSQEWSCWIFHHVQCTSPEHQILLCSHLQYLILNLKLHVWVCPFYLVLQHSLKAEAWKKNPWGLQNIQSINFIQENPELQISVSCAILTHFPEYHLLAMLQNRQLGKVDLCSDPVSPFRGLLQLHLSLTSSIFCARGSTYTLLYGDSFPSLGFPSCNSKMISSNSYICYNLSFQIYGNWNIFNWLKLTRVPLNVISLTFKQTNPTLPIFYNYCNADRVTFES